MDVSGDNALAPEAGDGGVAWTAVIGSIDRLPRDGATAFEVDGRRIAVFAVGDAHYAIDDYCTHGQSSLSEEGELHGVVVHCGLHRAQFDVTTGQIQRGPTRVSLRSYALTIEDGQVRATERPLVARRRTQADGAV